MHQRCIYLKNCIERNLVEIEKPLAVTKLSELTTISKSAIELPPSEIQLYSQHLLQLHIASLTNRHFSARF